MTVRRASTFVATSLLVLLSIAVAQAALLVLVVVFSSILQVQLNLQLGERVLTLWALRSYPSPVMPSMTVQQGGIVASSLFAVACGVGAAAWRYRQWRSA